MEDIIQIQRETVAEHFRAENIHDWPAVHDTFIQDESAYYDVVPLSTKFKGISGVRDFYQAIGAALPDFHVEVTGEYDTPGCSIREVTCTGTHKGEYCGVQASENLVRFEVAVFFIFGTGVNAGKLLAERIYFDNETVLRQMRGEENAPFGIGLADKIRQSTSAGH